MADSDEIKELKKRALEIKKLQKLKQVDQEWEANNMISSGGYHSARGLVEREFAIKEQLIDAGANLGDLDDPELQSRFSVSPSERKYWYEDGQLKFKLTSGKIDQFDFSNAELSREVFEAFWYLWEADNSGQYTKVQVKNKYEELHQKELFRDIGEVVSNIRASIINRKPIIRERIKWYCDTKTQEWIFRIS